MNSQTLSNLVIKSLIVFITFTLITSCKEKEIIKNTGVNKINKLKNLDNNLSKIISFSRPKNITFSYQNKQIKYRKLLKNTNIERPLSKPNIKQLLKSQELHKNEKQLITTFIDNSKEILADLSIKEQEIIDISKDYSDDFYFIFGVALTYEYNKNLSGENNILTDCLFEASGVTAIFALAESAYTLYGGEVAAGWAVDAAAAKAFRKAALKSVKKIFSKAFPGLGVAAMSYDFYICLKEARPSVQKNDYINKFKYNRNPLNDPLFKKYAHHE
ncbi:MAG: hypothetical protein KGV59_04860 [Tenacibaculum sp.]|nr:hypothetical protein [Tenacibaculum sp.]